MSDDAVPRGGNIAAPFNYQLREILELAELITGVDLPAADQASCIRFRALRRLYVEQALHLIEMVEERAVDLRRQLESILNDS